MSEPVAPMQCLWVEARLPAVWPFFGPAGWPYAAHPFPGGAAGSPVAAGAAHRWRWHSHPELQPESLAAAALPPGTVTAPQRSYERMDDKWKKTVGYFFFFFTQPSWLAANGATWVTHLVSVSANGDTSCTNGEEATNNAQCTYSISIFFSLFWVLCRVRLISSFIRSALRHLWWRASNFWSSGSALPSLYT